MRLVHKASGKTVHVGDVVTVPYHGKVRMSAIGFYGPGEWSNFTRKDLSCAVISYTTVDQTDQLVGNLAFNPGVLNSETVKRFSFTLEV